MQWREKTKHHVGSSMVSDSRDIIPYEHISQTHNNHQRDKHSRKESSELRSEDAAPTSSKKLASKIVTPSHENVTIRSNSANSHLCQIQSQGVRQVML